MADSEPTRDVVLRKLDELRSGSVARVDVAFWAMAIIDNDEMQVINQAVMRALTRLGAVDLPATDGDYLYTEADFEDWMADLNS